MQSTRLKWKIPGCWTPTGRRNPQAAFCFRVSYTSAAAFPILCLLLSSSASSGYSFLGEGTEETGASLMSLKKKEIQRKHLGITAQTIASVCPALTLSSEMHFLAEITTSSRSAPLFRCCTLKHREHHSHPAQPNASGSRKYRSRALAFNQTWNLLFTFQLALLSLGALQSLMSPLQRIFFFPTPVFQGSNMLPLLLDKLKVDYCAHPRNSF